jgi:acetamidase/formamidase
MGEMLDVMTAETGLGRAAALALASAQVSLRVTQVVNPARGVHAVWERRG